ncbi:MAG: hypothetical protein IT572_00665 [Deltaproteobacteria bacterium]|nr:hypothetical protein [Deltaproteobacteria bacterium]
MPPLGATARTQYADILFEASMHSRRQKHLALVLVFWGWLQACSGMTGSQTPGGPVASQPGGASLEAGSSTQGGQIPAPQAHAAPSFPGGQPAPDFKPEDKNQAGFLRFNAFFKADEDLSYDLHDAPPSLPVFLSGDMLCPDTQERPSPCRDGSVLRMVFFTGKSSTARFTETRIQAAKGTPPAFSIQVELSPLPSGQFQFEDFVFFLHPDPNRELIVEKNQSMECHQISNACGHGLEDLGAGWLEVAASYDKEFSPLTRIIPMRVQ